MSERIQELYMQAIEYADSVVPAERRYNDIYYAIAAGKHAELIVKECIAQCSYVPDSTEDWDKGVKWAENQIKHHFGVEE
jgi:hypothetical protein